MKINKKREAPGTTLETVKVPDVICLSTFAERNVEGVVWCGGCFSLLISCHTHVCSLFEFQLAHMEYPNTTFGKSPRSEEKEKGFDEETSFEDDSLIPEGFQLMQLIQTEATAFGKIENYFRLQEQPNSRQLVDKKEVRLLRPTPTVVCLREPMQGEVIPEIIEGFATVILGALES